MKDKPKAEEPKTFFQKMLFPVTFYSGTLLPEFLGNSHWNHITDNLILGALPIATEVSGMGNHRDKIIAACEEKGRPLGAVYSIVNPFEIKGENLGLTPVSPEDWQAKNVKHTLIPMDDFGGNIDINLLKNIVDDMHQVIESGKSVYVHCKAGKGRSFTIIIAYLLMHSDMNVTQIFGYIREKRPQVSPGSAQLELIEMFRAAFCQHKAPLDKNSIEFQSYRKDWKSTVARIQSSMGNMLSNANWSFKPTGADTPAQSIPAPVDVVVEEAPPTLVIKRKASTQNAAKRQKREVADEAYDDVNESKPETIVRSSKRLQNRV